MAGLPQLREAGWLYGADPLIPLALVRIEERADGTWLLLLNDPADSPTQRAEHPDEASARAALDRIYAEGRTDGRWKVYRPDNPHDRPATAVDH